MRTWTVRFLTPHSCGGSYYYVATYHACLSLLFISHSNYATPTKTWPRSGLPLHYLPWFFILTAVSHSFLTLLVMSRPSNKMSSSGCIDKIFQRTKLIVLVQRVAQSLCVQVSLLSPIATSRQLFLMR